MPHTPPPHDDRRPGRLATQQQRNRATRQSWSRYAPHRAQVTGLLEGAAPPEPGRLLVLGAGNCNDLDLARLLARFASIDLVDIDPEALEAGCRQQAVAGEARLRRHGGVDLAAGERPGAFPSGTWDVVASVGLMSQLVETAIEAAGVAGARDAAGRRRMAEVAARARDAHLAQLVDRAAPGGTGWLVTELVSSETVPELERVGDAELPALAAARAAAGNFFVGAHPAHVLAALKRHPRVRALHPHPPWRWPFPGRIYLVYALRIDIRTEPGPEAQSGMPQPDTLPRSSSPRPPL